MRTYIRPHAEGFTVHNGYQRPDHRLVIVSGGYTSRGFAYTLWRDGKIVARHVGDGATDAAIKEARRLVAG